MEKIDRIKTTSPANLPILFDYGSSKVIAADCSGYIQHILKGCPIVVRFTTIWAVTPLSRVFTG
jgi:hypothetical protein